MNVYFVSSFNAEIYYEKKVIHTILFSVNVKENYLYWKSLYQRQKFTKNNFLDTPFEITDDNCIRFTKTDHPIVFMHSECKDVFYKIFNRFKEVLEKTLKNNISKLDIEIKYYKQKLQHTKILRQKYTDNLDSVFSASLSQN
jgi:hypothetical protein